MNSRHNKTIIKIWQLKLPYQLSVLICFRFRTAELADIVLDLIHDSEECFFIFFRNIALDLIIEKIFAIPGVGGLTINAINGRDYPIFMLTTVFYTAIGLVASLVVDISYGFIDPRIRMGSKK